MSERLSDDVLLDIVHDGVATIAEQRKMAKELIILRALSKELKR